MKNVFRVYLFLLITLVSFACAEKNKRAEKEDLSVFSEYISGISSGAVKRADPIVVMFTQDVVDKSMINQAADKNILVFDPDIKGTCQWTSSNSLVFIPEKILGWNSSYTGTLALNKLIALPEGLPKEVIFTFFTTDKQLNITHKDLGLDDQGNYSLEGEILTSDLFDNKEIEQSLQAIHNKQNLKIIWEHHPESFQHLFSIQNIIRSNIGTQLSLLLKPVDNTIKTSTDNIEIPIPASGIFYVTAVKIKDIPDQVIEISFSDPINYRQDFRGVVSVGEEKELKFHTKNNVLSIYPKKRLSGEYALNLSAALENNQGKTMQKAYTKELYFGHIKPALRLLGKGVILPQSQGLILPFSAAGLNAVDVRIMQIFSNNIVSFFQNNDLKDTYKWDLNSVGRIIITKKISLLDRGAEDLSSWNAFNLDIASLIEVEPGAIYNIELGFRKAYSINNQEQENEEMDKFIPVEEELLYPSHNYESVFYKHYYDWKNKENPSSHSYYGPNRFVSRNVFCSDLGLVAKIDAVGKMTVYVSNLLTAAPEAGVRLKVFDYQNQILFEGATDTEGCFMFKPDRTPFVLIAQKSDQYGYLKLNNSTAIPTANFDVEGVRVEKGLKAYIYAERGVWRPGDSIYLHFVLQDLEKHLPMGHPISMEVYNPRAQFVQKMLTQRDERSIYPFHFATNKDDLTGNWRVVIKAGTSSFQRGIQVESIKPNRLKIELVTDDGILSAERSNTARLKSSWLHGTPAANMKAMVSAVLHPYTPEFENYKNYDFSTPYPRYSSNEFRLFDGKLDNKGEAIFSINFGKSSAVEGFLKAQISTKVFEGGGFSIRQQSIPYSASKNYLGLKINYSYPSWKKLDNDKNHLIEVVSVDEKGNPLDLKNIEIKLYDLDYHWWYQGNKNRLASYAGQTYHKPVYTSSLSTRNGKASFELEADKSRYGCYLLLVRSPDGHTCGQQLYFGLPWGSGIQKGDAQVLALVAEQTKYKVGETASLSFPSGQYSRALVTLENSKGILHQEWLGDLKSMNEYSFTTTADMAPNVYVNILLIQPYGQTANDLPIRLFGIASLSVEDEATKLQPVLDIPDQLRPERDYTIRVSESNKLAMDYTIALVDEGLLDLTNFRTPDPWAHFYAKEALGTKTYDIYNDVLGSFGSRLESMFAIGGSDQEVDLSSKKAERFVPVVEVLGPFRLEAGKKAEHKLRLKPYAGSVRAMLVAAGQGRYAQLEKSIRVSEPLMIYASLPRTLASGEAADVPLTIFAMDEALKNVRISMEAKGLLKSAGLIDTTIQFDTPGQQDLLFRIRAKEGRGLGKIIFTASSGKEKTIQEIELDVQHSNPPTREQSLKLLAEKEHWEINIKALGMPGTNTALLEVSSLLPLNLEAQLDYLNQYPHYCGEQVVSAVLPLLYMHKLLELDSETSQKYRQKVSVCIERLPRYQSLDRGFGFWPGQTRGEVWLSAYICYFMLEAEKAGYLVPSNLKRTGLDYLLKSVKNYKEYKSDYHAFNQAYALFVLARAGEPEIAAMNRLMKANCLNKQGKWLLASAYAQNGMKEPAYALLDLRDMEPAPASHHNYGSELRDRSILLQSLLMLGELEQAAPLAIKIATEINKASWQSTQTTAFVLSVLSEYSIRTSSASRMDLEIYQNGKLIHQGLGKQLLQLELDYDNSTELNLRLVNKSQGSVYALLSNRGVKAGVDISEQEKGLTLEISYRDHLGKAIDIRHLKQGTDFNIQVKLSNKTSFAVKNLALTQKIPAGWEIINERLFKPDADKEESNQYDYRDIRDDRVNTYFDLSPGQSKVFSIDLNASYCGEFVLAPVVCEAMYDNAYYTKKGGSKVVVTR